MSGLNAASQLIVSPASAWRSARSSCRPAATLRLDLASFALSIAARLDTGRPPMATVLMAGSVILTVPIILLFFAVERFLRGGLVLGAEKG